MFEISFAGEVIGTSKLETGDAPMGCALGKFLPNPYYFEFAETVRPEPDDEPDMKRWIGLTVSSTCGEKLRCLDVVLFEASFEGELDIEVDVIGVDRNQYDKFFPHHNRAYEAQFK